MYAKINNGAVDQYPYTYEQLKTSSPQSSWPVAMPPDRLAEYGMVHVVVISQPAHDTLTEKIVEKAPVFNAEKDRWEQSFDIVPLTADELRARVPTAVSMRQARLSLLEAGLLQAVNDAIAAMPGADGEAARIEWEYATEVRRDSPLVAALAGPLNLADADLNQLFISASGL